MKPVHIPRSIVIVIFILVAVTFLAGTMHTFDSAHAASAIMPTATVRSRTNKGTSLTPTAIPTPVPTPVPVSADTTGIIAIAILIVIIVLVGTTLGGSRPQKNKSH